MEPKPKSCQISESTYIGRNQPTSFMKLTGVPPRRAMMTLMMPPLMETKFTMMPTTTTTEMK